MANDKSDDEQSSSGFNLDPSLLMFLFLIPMLKNLFAPQQQIPVATQGSYVAADESSQGANNTNNNNNNIVQPEVVIGNNNQNYDTSWSGWERKHLIDPIPNDFGDLVDPLPISNVTPIQDSFPNVQSEITPIYTIQPYRPGGNGGFMI